MTHRASYWKTTTISLVAASLCLLVFVWVHSSDPQLVPTSLVGILLVAGLAACLLVAIGGLVCLWRDARETSGKEELLLHFALREPDTGFLSGICLRLCLRLEHILWREVWLPRPQKALQAAGAADL